MGDEGRFDALLSVLEEMREANAEVPIVVEGRRDVAALRALGLEGDIRPLHNGRAIFGLCEVIAREGAREVIVLTDWDRKGGLLHEQLSSGLAANGVRADASFRERIRAHASVELSDVESLAPYVRRGLRKFRGHTLEDHCAPDRLASGLGA